MRILIQPRPKALTEGGGDYLELQYTLEQLRALGVQADVSADRHADVSAFDLVEIFNVVEPAPSLAFYLNARRQNKPVIVRPFYWSLRRLWNAQLNKDGARADPRAERVLDLEHQVYAQRLGILLRGADRVLPLSQLESEHLVGEYGVPRERLHPVPMGVHSLFANGNAERFYQQFGVRDFILCVAEIALRKNQINLLRALVDDARPLVFMGQSVQAEYDAECQRLAARRENVLFIPKQPRATVADAYAAARVHALASLYDVAPLVTLEAASVGLPQVVTTECGMRDYLRDDAQYCDPDDFAGIRRAIDRAWHTPRNPELAARIVREFTWERTARERRAVYERVIADGPARVDHRAEVEELATVEDEPLRILWQWLEEQAQTTRELEAWAHQLQAQLQARRGGRAHPAQLLKRNKPS